jgi:hypothetical protein
MDPQYETCRFWVTWVSSDGQQGGYSVHSETEYTGYLDCNWQGAVWPTTAGYTTNSTEYWIKVTGSSSKGGS